MPIEVAGEAQFGQVVRQMNKMMDQLHKGYFSFCPAETWTPAVNVYENDTAYVVCVDLAGVDKEKIDLTVIDNELRLRGQRVVPTTPGQREGEAPTARLRVHLMEIDHGPFCRQVQLPNNVDKDRIAAQYLNGMLWIELPKK
jgi:HSP20 family protein